VSRRSLWVDRDHHRDPEQGPFSSARWRRQAEAAHERRSRPEEPAPAAPEPRRRRLPLFPLASLAVAAAALVLAVVALTGGDAQDGGLAPQVDSRPLPLSTAGRVAEAAGPGVVSVQANQAGGTARGTGFVVRTDGLVVTNAHVVGSAESAQLRFNDTGRLVSAEVLGTDPSSDLAVLRVDPGSVGSLRALRLADSEKVRVGDPVVAIGHPFGLDRTVTAGIVSGVGREIQAPDGFQIDEVIQTDAPINPGNSGGPLLDARGRVVGVNSQIATGGSGGNVGIGFAVPADTVRDVLPRLSRGETIRHAYLGVTTALHPQGAVVAAVTAGGPAASAGIRAGDVITAIDGRSVGDPDDVADIVADSRPGDEVEVEVLRGGDRQTLTVELTTRPTRTP
jgi:putative serine protease PepD